MVDWVNATTDDLHRSLANRVNRLGRLTKMKDDGIGVPPIVILNELDLVRQALDRIEQRYINDTEALRAEMVEAKREIDKEIEEAGGQEAWEKLHFDEPEGTA